MNYPPPTEALLLVGARVVTREHVIPGGWVEVRHGRIAGLGPAGTRPATGDAALVELGMGWLLPGFVDLHCHGGGGADFADDDPAALRRAADFHADHGTAAMLASLVSAPAGALIGQLARIADLVETSSTPVVGSHLEGPFLAPSHCGAHDPAHLVHPDPLALRRWHEASRGTLRVITLAPELPGTEEVIAAALELGIRVAVGHTAATYEQAREAFAAGATLATHLFNGMAALHHREPGPVLAALDAGVVCEAIADGHHLHPAVVRLLAAHPYARTALVTDAIAAAGAADGRYRLGSRDVTVQGGRAQLTGGSTLAGSTLTMAAALRWAVTEAGLSVQRASHAATGVPAQVLDLAGDRGAITKGAMADLVHLDEEMHMTLRVAGDRLIRL